MEKKVRYIMLLLCLFLLPMKVFALEDEITPLENKEEQVVQENLNIENNDLEDQEELEKIADPETILLEEESNELASDEIELAKETTKVEETKVEEITTQDVENNEGEILEPQVGETTVSETTELTEITLTGVNTDLVDSVSITFSGTSGEPEKYSLEREEWVLYGETTTYSTSDTAYNTELQAQGLYFESPIEDQYYDYDVVVKVADGYTLAEDIKVIIDGNIYGAYVYNFDEATNTGYIDVFLGIQAKYGDVELVETLDLSNVVKDAYVGQSPLFGATSETEHFTVYGEEWYYLTTQENEDGSIKYFVYVNTNNQELMYENETPFDKFESGKQYSYLIVVKADDNYRLAYTEGEDSERIYNVTVNGEKPEAFVYGYFDEDGSYYYYIEFLEIEPIEADTYEITENKDPLLNEDQLEEVTIGIDGDLEELENAYVDGNRVESSNYTIEKENSLITFIEDFIKTLTTGAHEISLRFKNGMMAYTTLTINPVEQPVNEEPNSNPIVTTETTEETVEAVVVEEKTTDGKLEVAKDKKEDVKEDKKVNIGLIVFLVILIIIAIAIPITTYKKEH